MLPHALFPPQNEYPNASLLYQFIFRILAQSVATDPGGVRDFQTLIVGVIFGGVARLICPATFQFLVVLRSPSKFEATGCWGKLFDERWSAGSLFWLDLTLAREKRSPHPVARNANFLSQ